MTVYRIADGHDQEASFTDINPQPASEAVRMPELVYYGNGQAEFNGTPFADLVWSGLSRAQYSALRTQLGVSDTVASNDVTIRLRLNSDSFGNYNATLIYLRTERREMWGWSRFSIRLNNLVAT